MNGFNDGVSKIWLVRINHGLDITGYDDGLECLDHLIRGLLIDGTAKDDIERAICYALTHLEVE